MECQCVKCHFAPENRSLSFGKLPQGLFRRLTFLVKSVPHPSDMPRLDLEATAHLCQGGLVVNGVHIPGKPRSITFTSAMPRWRPRQLLIVYHVGNPAGVVRQGFPERCT